MEPYSAEATSRADLISQASVCFKSGSVAEAAALLQRAEAEAPLLGMALLILAQALIGLRQNEPLHGLLPRLVEQTALDPAFLRPVGRIAVQLRTWPVAVELWSKLATDLPEDRECRLQLARCHSALEESAAALRAAEAVLAAVPEHPEAQKIQLRSQIALGLVADALVGAMPIVTADPKRAWQDFAAFQQSWAIVVCAGAFVRVAPDNPEIGVNLRRARIGWLATGFQQEMIGDHVEAFFAFKAASLAADDFDAQRGVGRTKRALIAEHRRHGAAGAAANPSGLDAATVSALCGADPEFAEAGLKPPGADPPIDRNRVKIVCKLAPAPADDRRRLAAHAQGDGALPDGSPLPGPSPVAG